MITVGVVTHHSARVLPGLLDSLPGALAGVPDWRLAVADNASADGSVDLVRRRFPAATVVDLGGNRGYAAGVNACAAVDPRAALLLCNPDVRLRPGAVAALGAATGSGVGITVPRLEDADGRLAHSLRRRPTVTRALGEALLGGRRASRFAALSEVVADPAAYTGPSRSDWATGAVMLVTRECLEAVGGWDESFFLYSEETDFALRAADAGFSLRLVPDAEAVHVGGDAHTSPALWALLTANRVRLFARRAGALRGAAFWSAVVAGEALRAAGRGRSTATHRAALEVLLRQRRNILGGRCVDFSR
ncbi:MAG TPA: glycosyltransferase family 2 protein [Mycobacteriales bacterium]|nr:glycosyltransferase family 2 protein [Mycobacteriales bacterium]